MKPCSPDTDSPPDQDPVRDQPIEPKPGNVRFAFRCTQPMAGLTHDVVPVQVVHNVHEDNHGQEAEIDLADESLFRLLTFLRGQAGDVDRGLLPWIGFVRIGNDLDIVHMGLVDVCCLNVTRWPGRHLFCCLWRSVVEERSSVNSATTTQY